jgi:hypothetical protein
MNYYSACEMYNLIISHHTPAKRKTRVEECHVELWCTIASYLEGCLFFIFNKKQQQNLYLDVYLSTTFVLV